MRFIVSSLISTSRQTHMVTSVRAKERETKRERESLRGGGERGGRKERLTDWSLILKDKYFRQMPSLTICPC